VRDLTDSLAEGLRRHVDEVRKRLPRASVLLQLDEPSLQAVLAGRVPTESGLSAYRPVDAADAATALRTVVEAAGVPVIVHSCAPEVPLRVVRDSRAAAVALDLSLLKELDPLGEAIEAGLGLFVGAAPTRPAGAAAPARPAGAAPARPSAGAAPARPPAAGSDGSAVGRGPDGKQIAERVRTLWTRLGFPLEKLSPQVVVTPACGLAGAGEKDARAVLAACREAARRLSEA
jgi:hypothetical protein